MGQEQEQRFLFLAAYINAEVVITKLHGILTLDVFFGNDMAQKIIDDLKDDRIKRRGLSLSGGDPLMPTNLNAIGSLIERVRTECPDKDIWLWTGYTLNHLTDEQQQVVDMLDVIVDGKFQKELSDPSLRFRGSSNQVIHTLSLDN